MGNSGLRLADAGFHEGELAVQHRAGVQDRAAQLRGMLEPAELSGIVVDVLSALVLAVVTGRDAEGHLWTSPLTGRPGFLEVPSPERLVVHAAPPAGDPLHHLPQGQAVGLLAIDFATRTRLRINGTLTRAGDALEIAVEQAFGNCTKYIQRRTFGPGAGTGARADVRHRARLSREDEDRIAAADTFFFGTTHPGRGNDTSHRGGAPGFVRLDAADLWWPDYPGNNLFNSFGNLAVDPTAALLFIDFRRGRTIQLSGDAALEWGEANAAGDDAGTGRRVRFTPRRVVSARIQGLREIAYLPYPRNPVVAGPDTSGDGNPAFRTQNSAGARPARRSS